MSTSELDEVLENYQDVFEGLGCLPGEYHIEMKQDAIPKQNHNRKVPQSMKENLKIKLDTLVQKGVAAKVDYLTDWICNIVC